MNHPLPSPRLLSLLILVFASSVPGCGSTSSTLHAQGTIATQTMTARVDHPVARDYLEGRPLPASLEALRRAHVAEERLPSESTLTELTTRYSTDGAPQIDPANSRLTVVFAPGWFYKTYGPETGGDFQRQLDQLANLRFPEHLLLVSYVPVPLSGGISDRGAFGYSRMRHLGPNDGLTMLVDQLLPGGLAIVEPGVDHYFDHPDRKLRSLALLEVLLNRLAATSGVEPETAPLAEGAAHASLGPK